MNSVIHTYSPLAQMTDLLHPAHAPHTVPALKVFPDKLYVVAVVSNPIRYHSRYRLYRAFEKHVEDAGAILYTVEMAFGGRPFEVTDAGNPRHVQVRSTHELWHKENLINIGISRLPAEARYIAWIDADVEFTRPDWCQETLHQLQHYAVVQLFSHAVDLGPDYSPVDMAYGWIESVKLGLPFAGANKKGVEVSASGKDVDGSVRQLKFGLKSQPYIKGAWHSGLAWAARREAIDALGGLLDIAILGSADRNMAAGLLGFMPQTIDPTFSPAYKSALLDWQERAERYVRRNVGQVPGTIFHFFHGRKAQRGYTSRWKILSEFQFDPYTDLMRDAQGLWQLRDKGDARSIGLRDAIRSYFRSRNEDGTEL